MNGTTALFAPKKKKNGKPEWAVDKHQKALAGTGFERCAPCPGTSGRTTENGHMGCSRAGATPVLITPDQAQCCDGKSPLAAVEVPRISPVFARLRKSA